MSERKQVSSEVAARLGISRQALMVYLHRHDDLKPRERLPDNDYLWSEEEVQRLIERRQRRKKAGSQQ